MYFFSSAFQCRIFERMLNITTDKPNLKLPFQCETSSTFPIGFNITCKRQLNITTNIETTRGQLTADSSRFKTIQGACQCHLLLIVVTALKFSNIIISVAVIYTYTHRLYISFIAHVSIVRIITCGMH